MSYEALKLSHSHVGPNPTTAYRSYHYVYAVLDPLYVTVNGIGTVVTNIRVVKGIRGTVIGFTYTIPAPYPARVVITYAPPGATVKQAIITVANYWTAIFNLPFYTPPFRIHGYEATRMWSLDAAERDANILLQTRQDEWYLFMESISAQDRFADSFARLVLRLEDLGDGRWRLEPIETNTANTFTLHVDLWDVWDNVGGAANNRVRETATIRPTVNPLWSLYKSGLELRDAIVKDLHLDPEDAWQLPL